MPSDNSAYTIHRFLPQEVEAYKAIRLEALRTEPGMFGNSFDMENAFADEQWLTRLSNEQGAVFGLYHISELIGLTGIVVQAEQADQGYMTQSYIRHPHRGRGLSRMLYDARLAWARARGLKRVTIGHRQSNLPSNASILRYGFEYTHSEERLWPDGMREAMMYYALDL